VKYLFHSGTGVIPGGPEPIFLIFHFGDER